MARPYDLEGSSGCRCRPFIRRSRHGAARRPATREILKSWLDGTVVREEWASTDSSTAGRWRVRARSHSVNA
ncbi:hypothetical protein GCM10018966_014500 [Streptomyces yanii]